MSSRGLHTNLWNSYKRFVQTKTTNMLKQKLKEFFQSRPEATVVFVALGVLFTDIEKATAYLGGVEKQTVATYTREDVAAFDAENKDSIPAENAENKTDTP